MRNYTSNTINLSILSLFVIAPFVGYFSQTFLGKGFGTVMIPLLILGSTLLLFLRKELSFPRPLIFLALFAVYTMVSDAVLTDKEFTVSYFISNDIMATVLAIFIVENTKFSEKYIHNTIVISIVILVIAFFVTLIQEFVNLYFFVSPLVVSALKVLPPWEMRIPSIYSWIGDLTAIGHCFFPILALILCEQLKNKSKYTWVFYILGAIVAFLSKSRFIMLNFLFLLLLIPIYRKIKFISLVKFVVITAISIAAFLAISKQFNFKVGEVVEKRILAKDEGNIGGTRFLAFDLFGKLFKDNAIFGKGKLHEFGGKSKDYDLVRALKGRSSQLHVGYLSLFYYYGIIGGSIFIAFLLFASYDMYKSAQQHHYWGPFFGFAQFLLANFTLVYLHVFFAGYIICFMFNRYYISQHENLNK